MQNENLQFHQNPHYLLISTDSVVSGSKHSLLNLDREQVSQINGLSCKKIKIKESTFRYSFHEEPELQFAEGCGHVLCKV